MSMPRGLDLNVLDNRPVTSLRVKENEHPNSPRIGGKRKFGTETSGPKFLDEDAARAMDNCDLTLSLGPSVTDAAAAAALPPHRSSAFATPSSAPEHLHHQEHNVSPPHCQQQAPLCDYQQQLAAAMVTPSHAPPEMAAPASVHTASTLHDETPATVSPAGLDPSPPLEICTLTHTSTLLLPADYRVDLRELALTIPVGGDKVGDIVGARFAPPTGEPVERGAAGFIRRGGKRDFGNQLQLRLRTASDSRVQVKVFSTGALATTGARAEVDASTAVATVCQWARSVGLPVRGHGPVELRNALCTGFVGAPNALWNVDNIFELARREPEHGVVPHHIKARGRAAIVEVCDIAEHEGAHAPRCIIHPSGSVQVMGKVTPKVAGVVYHKVRKLLVRLHEVSPSSLALLALSAPGRKSKARRLLKTQQRAQQAAAASTPAAAASASASPMASPECLRPASASTVAHSPSASPPEFALPELAAMATSAGNVPEADTLMRLAEVAEVEYTPKPRRPAALARAAHATPPTVERAAPGPGRSARSSRKVRATSSLGFAVPVAPMTT